MSSRGYVGLNADLHQETERFLAEFDVGWTEEAFANSAGGMPFSDEEVRRAVLVELVKIDLERLWTSGKGRQLESYLKACPELGDAATVEPELILAEYEARSLAGTSPDLCEIAKRFPKQAEELRQLVAELDVAGIDPTPSQADRATKSQRPSTQIGEQGLLMTRQLPERFGKYRIIRRLGEGGMGAVYLAEDTKLRRRVALKVPHATQLSSPELLERFSREARAAAALDHPNICSIYDVNEIDGIRYIEMAFIDGQDLSERIATGKRLEQRQIAMIVAKLAAALKEAHENNVNHRDVKPSNIRLKKNGEPVIMDFGLAKLSGTNDFSLTGAGQSMGTPFYMAPEQAMGDAKESTPAYDIYSLGAVMYEMLTGCPPFDGSNVYTVIKQVIESAPTPPREHRPEIDARLETICLKAMSKQAEDRFTLMAEFADALKQFLRDTRPPSSQAQENKKNEQQIPSGDVETKSVAPRRVNTRPRSYLVLATGLALLIAGIVYLPTLLLVVLNQGTLVIETDDPQVRVAFENHRVMIHDLAKGESYQLSVGRNRLKTGTFEIDVQNVSSDLTFSMDRFTITRGGKKIISVRFEPSSPRPSTQPEDLLALIDVERDTLFDDRFRADWRFDENVLVSSENGPACLQIPYIPPDEYELELVVERMAGITNNGPQIGIVVGGRQCEVLVDGWGPDEFYSALHVNDESRDHKYVGRVLPSSGPLSVKCTVLKTRVRLECGGREIFDWKGDPDDLRVDPSHAPADPKVLFLITWHCSFRVSELRLTPITGQGKRITFTSRAANPALAAADRFMWRGGAVNGRTAEIETVGELPESFSPQEVDLRGVFSAADIPHINALDGLEELDLGSTKLTDRDLERLAEMGSLKTLDLRLTRITNQGLRHLKKFPQLKRLVLAGTTISDDALQHLVGLTQLDYLDVRYTNVSSSGLQAFTALRTSPPPELVHTVAAKAADSYPSVDLLQFIDVERDEKEGRQDAGGARFDGEALLFNPRPDWPTAVLIRHVLPEEYVLEMVAQVSGYTDLIIGLVAGESRFNLLLGPGRTFLTTDNEHSYSRRMYRAMYQSGTHQKHERPSTIVVTVRRSRISVARDNQLLTEWKGDTTNLFATPDYHDGPQRYPFIRADGDAQITKLQLTPLK